MPSLRTSPIAVDGPAASGKGTLAQGIADALGFAHLDTGQLYRRIAFACLQAKLADDETQEITALMRDTDWSAPMETHLLRTAEVSQYAALVSTHKPVRELITDYQRQFAARPTGAVLDGRDIGTVICPDAPCKIFVVASLEVRAQRRWQERQNNSPAPSLDAIREEIALRDKQDETRPISPLRQAPDAFVLDTSALDIATALTQALDFIKSKE